MARFIKYLAIPVFAVAFLAVADTSSAKAQGFSLQIGGFGISSGHRHHGHQPSFRPAFGPSFGGYYGSPGYFHDTSHLHYHAPQLVPHNGHLDFVPGHYDVHRTGHWHH